MDSEREDRIRARAHRIWETEGWPDNRDAEHWAQAIREIEAEEQAGSGIAGGVAAEPDDAEAPRVSPADAILGTGNSANR